MARAISLFLSLLLLLQGARISFADIVQLDELIEHARYHQQQFGDNFLTFLSKHYGSQKEDHSRNHREEKPQHEQLPFQQLAHMMGAYAFTLRQPLPELVFPPENSAGHQPNFHYFRPGSTGFRSGIFQPPKQA